MLGIGAGATLASWNDAEYTTATFKAGAFGIVGATDGATFTDHNPGGTPSTPAAALSFQITGGQIAAMAPGNTAYALFSVKTINPSVAGSVQLQANAANSTGLGAFLMYRVRSIAGTTCTSATFGGGTDVIAGAGSTDVVLTTSAAASQALTANGGNQMNYCFAVTLPSNTGNAAQGQTLSPAWQFVATST